MDLPPVLAADRVYAATAIGVCCRAWWRSSRWTGRVLVAPTEMRIHLEGNSREPDVLFIRSQNLRLTADRLEGPADLIVEVISDDSVGRDRGEKFYEYEEGGVEEYWLFDPRPGRERIEGYRLQDGRYRPILADAQGRLPSQVIPGLWFEEVWLLAADLPEVMPLVQAILAQDKS